MSEGIPEVSPSHLKTHKIEEEERRKKQTSQSPPTHSTPASLCLPLKRDGKRKYIITALKIRDTRQTYIRTLTKTERFTGSTDKTNTNNRERKEEKVLHHFSHTLFFSHTQTHSLLLPLSDCSKSRL